MNDRVSIAIDGPSGAGKSTLARRCAAAFGFLYADTGAIYRTVGLAAIRAGIDRRSGAAVEALLPDLKIEMKYNEEGEQRMLLNGEDVSDMIRMPEVSLAASDVSALPAVRTFLMEMQRSLARNHSVIMDGRDIGTVVLPDADLKVFVTDNQWDADNNDEIWYYVDSNFDATSKIFWVNSVLDADIKVFFVDSNMDAGWTRGNNWQNRL